MDEIEIANQGEHYDQVDMKLTEEQRATFRSMNSKSRNKRSLYDKLYDVRWPEAVVPVTFSSKFSEAEKVTINKAMRTIESVSCVRFKEYPSNSAPSNFIYFYKGRGCSSYIGRINGRQELSLGSGCVHADTVIHELLHALGFFHEQSRQDRDQYVTIKTENIQQGKQNNFDISVYSYKDGLGVKYDPESIMHYGRFTFSKNRWSLPTIEWKSNPNRKLGGKKLTASDILQLNLYYECKGYAKTTRPTAITKTTTRPMTTTTTTTRPTTTTTTTTRPTTTTTTTTRPTTTTTTTTRPTTTTTTTTRPTTTTTTKTRPTTKTKTAQPTTTIKTTPKAMTTIRPTTKSSKVCGDEIYLCSKVFVNRAICAFGRFCRRSCGLCSGPRENMCDNFVNAINVGCKSSRRKEHCVSKDKRERRRMKQECPKTCCMRGQFYE
ncbi:protein SpAN-like isoform X2 [Hydractinia symbiolongicarpus]|uniref:protein SpAN-like isoform X2 n=1 Tax=Hydractinia symbiolongicarpus TaxID=13093 RepID=UPI00254CDCA5|nr:protein SpAN-like isoform X2 [Hydractinia symbiolongicarpus]